MDTNLRAVKNYVTPEGRVPFEEWVQSLNDKRAIARILQRINRIRLGNLGDSRSIGSGVYELRIHFGLGFRIYFGVADAQTVILLIAGDKSSQKKDISIAQNYWKEYQQSAN